MDLQAAGHAFLKFIKCCVCEHLVTPPVSGCTAGHLLCQVCFVRFVALNNTLCPVCRRILNKNETVSRMLIQNNLALPCRYRSEGCQQTVRLELMTSHVFFDCRFRDINCKISQDCEDHQVTVPLSEFKNHLIAKHSAQEMTLLRSNETENTERVLRNLQIKLDFFDTETRIHTTVLHCGEKTVATAVAVFKDILYIWVYSLNNLSSSDSDKVDIKIESLNGGQFKAKFKHLPIEGMRANTLEAILKEGSFASISIALLKHTADNVNNVEIDIVLDIYVD